MIYTTNAIETVNARIRKAVKARGHFPTEAAALKCVYLAVMSLDPTGRGRQRWTNRWKAALNAFDIAFDDVVRRTGLTRISYTANLTGPAVAEAEVVSSVRRRPWALWLRRTWRPARR